MTEDLKYPHDKKYFIAYDGDYINIVFGACDPKQVVTTGLQYLDCYNTYAELEALLVSKGYTAQQVKDNFYA